MDATDKTKPSVPVVGLSRQAIAELTDEEAIATVVLLGAKLHYVEVNGRVLYYYCTTPGNGYEYTSSRVSYGDAARQYLNR